MSMNTVPERLAALRAAMDANGVDLYLIPVGDPHSSEYLPDHYTSLTYFSGFHGENSNFVVTRDKSALWADGRYFVQAEKEIAGTEIELERMGEPGVPTVEQYCADALPEGGVLGLCGLTASCQLVRSVQKALDAKHGTIKTLNLEDELWTEGRPALPETPAWLLSKEYAGFAPAEKLEQLRAKLKELGCTAQLVGKLDNLAWLLNLRAMDIQCTPYAMAYCYVTGDRAVLFINTRRLGAEAAAELKENGVEIAEYDDILTFLAAETEAQTVLADPASVNYAVYETLRNNPVLTVKDEADDVSLEDIIDNGDGTYKVSGKTTLYDFERYFKFRDKDFQESESVTIAGYLLENYKVKLGSVITIGQFDIKITEFNRNYIEWLEVSHHQEEKE